MPVEPFLVSVTPSQDSMRTLGKFLVAVCMLVVYMVVQGQPLGQYSLLITIIH